MFRNDKEALPERRCADPSKARDEELIGEKVFMNKGRYAESHVPAWLGPPALCIKIPFATGTITPMRGFTVPAVVSECE
jgi:hypothetical protein